MTHLPDDELLRYLDGELDAADRGRVERHLEGCPDCRREVASLRRTSERLSEDLERAGLPEALREFEPTRSPPGSGTRRGIVAAAATVLLLVAAAGLAAVPGSPLRAWLSESLAEVSAWLVDDPEPAEAAAAGLAVEPHDGAVVVAVDGAERGATVRVRIVNGAYAAVWARGARYHTAAGRVDVREPTGDIRVQLPRSAVRVELRIDGEPVFVRAGGSVEVMAPGVDSVGDEYEYAVGAGR